jgi:hypothetical protein
MVRRAALSVGLLLAAGSAWGGERDVWVLPTAISPESADTDVDLKSLAAQLDTVWPSALRDFGLDPFTTDAPVPHNEATWLLAAQHDGVLVPSLEHSAEGIVLRLVLAPYGRQTLHVTRAAINPAEPALVELKALTELRRLIEPSLRAATLPAATTPGAWAPEPSAGRSAGRAVLAIHGAALGGYVGFALQRAAGSQDARLTIPLTAVGAGIGLGASVVIADEWDITVGRAWYLSAGLGWPALGTWLLADGFGWGQRGNRYGYPLLGAGAGLGLSVAALSLGPVNGSGSLWAHSSAGLGVLAGGLAEMLVRGDADRTPRRGAGLGALAGVVAGGILAYCPQMPNSSDLLFVDLGSVLGGLVGAAVATPALLQESNRNGDRIWAASALAGMGLGAVAGAWLPARSRPPSSTEPTRLVPAPVGSGLGAVMVGAW